MPLTLSALDQSPIRSGGTPAEAIQETIALAKATEAMGYRRYWLAEHHSSDSFAGAAPEVLLARIAAETTRMRVGTGGVMLTHYSPFKVAETFRMLETLYPGRIDLGIGRAPGSDQRTTMALRYAGEMIDPSHYPRMVADLMDFVGEGVAADHPFASVRAMPSGDTAPALWLLGSSDQSAAVAAHFGCAFSYAQFINHTNGEAVMAAYRAAFKPSARLAEPAGNIGVFVICADTEEAAKRLARSRDLWRLRIQRGEFLPIPSVEEADAYPYTDIERATIARSQKRYVVGAPEQVKTALEIMATAYGVSEIVVLSICHGAADRLRSYALLAEVFNLASA